MIERDIQLAQLASLPELVMRGGGVCALVCGEAGAGKTTLLRHFVGLLAQQTPRLWAACEPMAVPRPLGPFADLADHWPPSLAAALREGRDHPGLLAELRDALARLGPAPVLVIEDLHWADAATLDALRYLGRRLADLRVLLVLSFRDDDSVACEPLKAILGELPGRHVVRVAVPPLSRDAVHRLAQLAARPIAGLYEVTAGNAFFVTETLSDPTGALPASVCDAVLARLARLSGAARAGAELVAVSPTPLELGVIEGFSDAAPDAFDECCDKGLLRCDGRRLAFRHELARQAVLQTIAPLRVERLHARLFDALGAMPSPSLQRLVHHATHAGLDREVLTLAPQAAQAAANLSSHHEAAAQYRRALACHTPLPDDERATLLEAAAVQFRLVGATDEAVAANEKALSLRRRLGDDVRVAVNLRLLATDRCQVYGDHATARTLIEESAATLRRVGAVAEVARTCAEHSRMLSTWSEHAQSIRVGDEAVALAETLPDAPAAVATRVLALRAAAGARIFVSNDPIAQGYIECALELARSIAADESIAQLLVLQQLIAVLYRHHDRSLALAEQGIAWCAARDYDALRARLLDNRALSLLELGRWDEADAALHECLALAACNWRLRHSARYLQARLQARRGEDEAWPYWEALRQAPMAHPLGYRLPAILAACTEAAWLLGLNALAADTAQAGAQDALRIGDARLLGPLLVWLHRLGKPVPTTALKIAPEHALELAGRHAEASQAWSRHGCTYEAALATLHGGAATLPEALQTFERLQAAPAADIARARMRALGLKGVRRGPQARTRNDAQGLTPRQRQIHALLVLGLSNAGIAQRLHRSERTIESHVAQVLAKLGRCSRAELRERESDS